MDEGRYVALLAALLNRESRPRERERRVREANRELYTEVCGNDTIVRADLALCAAAKQERETK